MPSFGIFALSSRHGPGFRMPFERRRFDKICLVSGGDGFLDRAGALGVPLSDGDLLVVPAGCRHRFRDRPRAPLTLNVVCVARRGRGAALRALLGRARQGRPLPLGDAYRRGQVLRQIRAMVFEQTRRAPYFRQAMEAQLEDLAVTVLRARAARPPDARRHSGPAARVRGSLAWLAGHFREPVRIPALARMAGMSYRSYTEHFRRASGRTVAQHLAGLRAGYALERLRAGSGIVDAALDAGFNDLAHFYRVFRRLHGTTPGKARYSPPHVHHDGERAAPASLFGRRRRPRRPQGSGPRRLEGGAGRTDAVQAVRPARQGR
jgi:AraC-like DNA-binding protein